MGPYPSMNKHVEVLNRMLGQHPAIGFVPDRFSDGHREPQYKWFWSPDLTYLGRKDGTMQRLRQSTVDTWILAKWIAPDPESVWDQQCGGELGHSRNGWWMMTDYVLPRGVEPTEELTSLAIGAIVASRDLSFSAAKQIVEERHKKSAREERNTINDLVDSELPEHFVVPGKRGGSRSFGGVKDLAIPERTTIQ